VHVYAISVMVPWFDSIAYNAVMCSLPRVYGNESIQPDIFSRGTREEVQTQEGAVWPEAGAKAMVSDVG
jgi:hypothetical protein